MVEEARWDNNEAEDAEIGEDQETTQLLMAHHPVTLDKEQSRQVSESSSTKSSPTNDKSSLFPYDQPSRFLSVPPPLTLTSELDRLRDELSFERTLLEKERTGRLAAELELDRRSRDDRSAASVVERYMAYSQTASLGLHASLQTLRARHTATLATLSTSLAECQRELVEERQRVEGLMLRLGEVGAEVARESEGRRREVGL